MAAKRHRLHAAPRSARPPAGRSRRRRRRTRTVPILRAIAAPTAARRPPRPRSPARTPAPRPTSRPTRPTAAPRPPTRGARPAGRCRPQRRGAALHGHDGAAHRSTTAAHTTFPQRDAAPRGRPHGHRDPTHHDDHVPTPGLTPGDDPSGAMPPSAPETTTGAASTAARRPRTRNTLRAGRRPLRRHEVAPRARTHSRRDPQQCKAHACAARPDGQQRPRQHGAAPRGRLQRHDSRPRVVHHEARRPPPPPALLTAAAPRPHGVASFRGTRPPTPVDATADATTSGGGEKPPHIADTTCIGLLLHSA